MIRSPYPWCAIQSKGSSPVANAILLTLFCLFTAVTPALAKGGIVTTFLADGSVPAIAVSTQPPAMPTVVRAGVHLIKLTHVAGAESPDPEFAAELYLTVTWHDPRLALPAGTGGQRFYQEGDALAELNRIWHPDLSFADEKAKPVLEDVELAIDEAGKVMLQEHMTVIFTTSFALRRFPFDRQSFRMRLHSFEWDRSQLKLKPLSEEIAREPDAGLPEWHIENYYESLSIAREAGGYRQFSQIVFSIDAQREGAYYLYKILLPMIIVIVLSWSNFWIVGSGDGRIRLTFLCLLAVIAYDSVLSKYLPRLNSITFMDSIAIFGIVVLAINVIENAWVHHLFRTDRKEKAVRVDRWAKRVVPTAGIATLLGLAVYYLG